jgi:hypothetical protein
MPHKKRKVRKKRDSRTHGYSRVGRAISTVVDTAELIRGFS